MVFGILRTDLIFSPTKFLVGSKWPNFGPTKFCPMK